MSNSTCNFKLCWLVVKLGSSTIADEKADFWSRSDHDLSQCTLKGTHLEYFKINFYVKVMDQFITVKFRMSKAGEGNFLRHGLFFESLFHTRGKDNL